MLSNQSLTLAGRLLLSTLAMLVINSAVAAPGTLANEPLQTSSSAPPNIMFMLDDSGSMTNIVPDVPYDPDTEYLSSCPSANQAGSPIKIYINSSDEVKIQDGGSNYDYGTGSGERCFVTDDTYSAKLYANQSDGSGGLETSNYIGASYDGNFLNWYFSSPDPSGCSNTWSGSGRKPCTESRLTVMKSAATTIVDSLGGNMRAGLAAYNGGDGGSLKELIEDIDASKKSALKTAINNLSPTNSTPLAETLSDIGRYFTNGYSSSDELTLHPEAASPTTATVANVFDNHSISNDTGDTLNNPITSYCQKSFSILLTDGKPQYDQDISSHLADYDGDCATGCGSHDQKTSGGYSYASNGSDYLDDVAQALYEMDLRPDLTGGDGIINNLITYMITFADKDAINDPLIQDAGNQGGGESLSAENAAGLRAAFEAATSTIIAQSSTSSAVTFNSSTLSSQSAVYQALFNTVRWSGELRSIPLDGFTGAVQTNCTPGDDNCWSASDQLDAQGPDTRTILTYHPDQYEGRAFRAPANYKNPTTDEVHSSLVNDLCAGPNIPHTCGTTTDSTEQSENQAYIEDLVAYLRGDRSNEGEGRNFRNRTTVLGDIVNASPVYVSEPSSNWPNKPPFPPTPEPTTTDPDNSYSNWTRTSIKDRAAVVYAASNDGMLHGFRTTESSSGAGDAGNEVFAYIPTGTFSTANNGGLHYLADPDYQHLYYNDLTPTISDVYIKHRDSSGTLTSNPKWRTMLVGGQRGGGRMLYMLDITDPSKFSEANAEQLVEWEFTHPDLGYSFSKPTIAMMNNGRFAAIFGNGYKSGDCLAKLFVVYLDGGQDGTWTEGDDYHVYNTGVGDAADCNGLSTPAVVDLNSDRVADRVYAGDLHGNLWAFDLCNFDTTSDVCQSTGWGLANASPIMTATDDANPANRQPITVKPVVSRDPATTGSDDLLITFGTGQYLTDADKSDPSVQTMYGVREYTALTNGGTYGLDPRRNQDNFIEQDITTTTDCSSVTGCTGSLRSISTPEETMSNGGNMSNGWLIDLPTAGERVVVNPAIRNNILFFNTLIPDDTVCSAGGSGWLMSVNLANGGIPDRVIFDINNDGVIDADDKLGGDPPVGQKVGSIPAESTFLGDKQYTPDSEGNINVRDVNIGKVKREGRMSWRELFAD